MKPQDFWEVYVQDDSGKILHCKALWNAESIEREVYLLKTHPKIIKHPGPLVFRWRLHSCPF